MDISLNISDSSLNYIDTEENNHYTLIYDKASRLIENILIRLNSR